MKVILLFELDLAAYKNKYFELLAAEGYFKNRDTFKVNKVLFRYTKLPKLRRTNRLVAAKKFYRSDSLLYIKKKAVALLFEEDFFDDLQLIFEE